MEYRLICNGRLIAGADEARAIAGIKRFTGLSEQAIRDKLLSGQRVRLKSSTDKSKIDALYTALTGAGLDVEIESDAVVTPASPGAEKARAPRRSGAGKRWALGIALVLVMLIGGAGVYLWQLSKVPFSAEAQTIEAALADGQLVMIGHANVSKLVDLHRLLVGEPDPAVLPLGEDRQEVLAALFNGPANLRVRLDQIFVAVHDTGEDAHVASSLLMSGNFDKDAVLSTYRRFNDVVAQSDGAWFELKAQPNPDMEGAECPQDPRAQARQRPAAPDYLYISPRWILRVNDQAYGTQLIERMQAGAIAAQDLMRWQQYRSGQLASLMVMSIPETGRALGGMEGMLAQRAASEHTQVTGGALALSADLLALSLNVNLSLFSNDTAWKQDVTSKIRASLDGLKDDTRQVTPTLGKLLSRIQVAGQAEALEIDVALDAGVLDNIGQIFEEGLGGLLELGMSVNQHAEAGADQLQSNPKDYVSNAALANLPAMVLKPHESQPLFMQGPFAVDLNTVRMNDEGLLEVQIQGKVALPSGEGPFGGNRTGEVTMLIDAVTDAAGQDMRRDERCVKSVGRFGGTRNHEPETSQNLFQDHAQINKTVRLRPEAHVQDVQQIRGHISFAAPVAVQKFNVPLRAGASIEHGGMRFYLARIGERSVSYQVSGARERLVEVRALNREGKALRTGWRMSSSGKDDGRATQQFEGNIHALEVYVAGKNAEHKVAFELKNLFTVTRQDDRPVRVVLAPARIDARAWDAYAKLDMRKLGFDPKQWYVSGQDKTPVASKHWGGVSKYVTHTPAQWGNTPQAHIYYPMLPELPGVLSAFSYQIDEPAEKDGPTSHYVQVSYPYNTRSGEVVVKHSLAGKPLNAHSISFRTGLQENERLQELKGKLVFRLPTRTRSTQIALNELWQGKSINGVTVTLTEVGRGMFPGYALKIDGDLTRLVNLHGLDGEGKRVMANPINYQSDGYWTMTLPFGKGIETVELILAEKQKVMEYPFALRAEYPQPK